MTQKRRLGVIGAGNMGSGIAQKMATEGFQVVLVDLDDDALERGFGGIQATLKEAVERKIHSAETVATILGRIRPTTDWSKLAKVELVVEAVFENLAVKKDVFARLDRVCNDSTILATNTSSFYVRDLAESVSNPERVMGLHYFYHPAKNRLVEVVPSEYTSRETIERAWTVQEAMGKTPILCADAPGFIVNRYFVPWLNESVRLLEEGHSIASIEQAAKEGFRIPMGPFELMNVTGIPIALHAATTLGQELGNFYAPAKRLQEQVDRGEPWPLDGDGDAGVAQQIQERLFGTVFVVAGELVDAQVGTIEDTDIGARVGLRWAKGPFELMNRIGIEHAVTNAAATADRYHRNLPAVLSRQKAQEQPFSFRLVEFSKVGDVITLTLNRPDAMNAINQEVVAQLAAQFDRANQDPDAGAIVIAGKGKGFVAGADIRFFVRNIEVRDFDAIYEFTKQGQDLLNRFARSEKVVIARLDGLSLGGGSELALACDYIVATERGSMGFPETGIGIYPGLGGTQRVSRRAGVGVARWLILTGQTIDANTAAALGLVDKVAPHESLGEAIRELAARGKADRQQVPATPVTGGQSALADWFAETPLEELMAMDAKTQTDAAKARAVKHISHKAPIALRIADELIQQGAKMSLADGLSLELFHLQEIFQTRDAYEGLSTLGKSRPRFEGR